MCSIILVYRIIYHTQFLTLTLWLLSFRPNHINAFLSSPARHQWPVYKFVRVCVCVHNWTSIDIDSIYRYGITDTLCSICPLLDINNMEKVMCYRYSLHYSFVYCNRIKCTVDQCSVIYVNKREAKYICTTFPYTIDLQVNFI